MRGYCRMKYGSPVEAGDERLGHREGWADQPPHRSRTHRGTIALKKTSKPTLEVVPWLIQVPEPCDGIIAVIPPCLARLRASAPSRHGFVRVLALVRRSSELSNAGLESSSQPWRGPLLPWDGMERARVRRASALHKLLNPSRPSIPGGKMRPMKWIDSFHSILGTVSRICWSCLEGLGSGEFWTTPILFGYDSCAAKHPKYLTAGGLARH
jgi:hypothetical protein